MILLISFHIKKPRPSAAAIGKIDAMVFIGGIVIGIYLYAFTYEALWEDLRNSTSIGKVKIGELIGVSDGVAVFAFILMAFVVFWMVDTRKIFFPSICHNSS